MLEVWYDVETTGLDVTKGAAVCQLACLLVKDGLVVDQLNRRVNISSYLRPVTISQKALEINGRSRESLYEGIEVRELMSELCELVHPHGKATLIGYNNNAFDRHFLADLFNQVDYKYEVYFEYKQIDVFEFIKALHFSNVIPKSGNQKLLSMAEAFGVAEENAHDAFADIKMTRNLYNKIIGGLTYVSN